MAVRFLTQHGVRIIDRNFHAGRSGEIDLIGYDGNTLIFVEVKYRSSARFGYAAEAVTATKQKTIIKAARYYMLVHRIPPEQAVRFDVVTLERVEDNREHIQWIRDAFQV